MKSLGKVRSKPTQFKLFENFLMVEGNLGQLGKDSIDPHVNSVYPNSMPSDKEKIVPMFCYPRGIKCRALSSEQEVGQVLEDNEMDSSIFLLNSEFTTTGASESRVKNEAMEIANPNFNLYGICLKVKVVAQLGIVNYALSKTYVILTYFPFVRFFLNILAMTISIFPPTQTPLNKRRSTLCRVVCPTSRGPLFNPLETLRKQ